MILFAPGCRCLRSRRVFWLIPGRAERLISISWCGPKTTWWRPRTRRLSFTWTCRVRCGWGLRSAGVVGPPPVRGSWAAPSGLTWATWLLESSTWKVRDAKCIWMYGHSMAGVRIKGKDYRLQKTKGLKTLNGNQWRYLGVNHIYVYIYIFEYYMSELEDAITTRKKYFVVYIIHQGSRHIHVHIYLLFWGSPVLTKNPRW